MTRKGSIGRRYFGEATGPLTASTKAIQSTANDR